MKRQGGFVPALCLLFLAMLACQTLNLGQGALSGNDLYLKVRNDALQTKAGALGLQLDPTSNVPYGVLMDNMFDSQSVSTVISFSTGDSSFIVNSGNGRTDGGSIPGVRSAAKNFTSVAAAFVGRMNLTTVYPLPTVLGNYRFYVITPRGVYASAELTEEQIMGGPFVRLWDAGAAVITAFSLSDQQKP